MEGGDSSNGKRSMQYVRGILRNKNSGKGAAQENLKFKNSLIFEFKMVP
jgi:hypothetical protein